MTPLLATAETVAENASFFPPDFWPHVVMALIAVVFAAALFYPFWRWIDKLTPGDLNKELLGTADVRDANNNIVTHGKQPNVALAIVVAALVLGFFQVIAAAVR
jgi:hypothetical protein